MVEHDDSGFADRADEASIATTRRRLVYENRFAAIYDDEVRFSDGQHGTHLRVVEASGRIGVAALATCGSRVALVRTYRYPLRKWQWAIPRGFGSHPDPSVSAKRELEEELGRVPDSIELLIDITPNSGLLAGHVRIFVARYDTPVDTPRDTREVVEVQWIDVGKVRERIISGALDDAFTIAAVGAAILKHIAPFN